jgi:hypothetical protein
MEQSWDGLRYEIDRSWKVKALEILVVVYDSDVVSIRYVCRLESITTWSEIDRWVM